MTQTSQPPKAPASSSAKPRVKHDHDWHSADYVGDWRVRDATRAERAMWLARMVSAVPFTKDADLRVLDVGGGFGPASKAVLQAFPRAQVTLHDYSQVMFDAAREYLADYAGRVNYARGDLWDRSWTAQLGGPFDLVVSAICIHNLMDMPVIAACYGEIRTVLKPGGTFLDYDHFDHIEDMDTHLKLFEEAGYAQVECLWYESPTAIVRARA